MRPEKVVRVLEALPAALPEPKQLAVHGHVRSFLDVGEGPVLLLLHGIGSDARTWEPVVGDLVARGYRVIAPDFLGHGRSDKPRADYSLGGFANGMRDLLTILDVETATIVGHSFGGGVAMQFAYQFPERTERVVLVGSGGLGRDIHPVLRALTCPGGGTALTLATSSKVLGAATPVLRLLHRTRLPGTADLAEMAIVYEGLADPDARRAFLHVLRAAVDWHGQVVTMLDRSYLASAMPVCVVWGARDTVIPVAHADVAHEALPHARLEVFGRAGHFPHRDDPERFVRVVDSFIRDTPAARATRTDWRALLVDRLGRS